MFFLQNKADSCCVSNAPSGEKVSFSIALFDSHTAEHTLLSFSTNYILKLFVHYDFEMLHLV